MPKSPITELRPTLGPLVCDWVEEFLCHGPGDIEGQPIELDSEFRAFIYRAYEIWPRGSHQAGRRVYRRAVLSRPKGRAKSELAGIIACAEGLAPVRFAGWDAHGNPVGQEIVGAIVRCFATEETQAGNTYDNVQYMLEHGAVFDEYEVDPGLSRSLLPGSGQIIAQSSSASSKDGGKDTFDVFDETHLWVAERLKKLHGTVTRNLMKRRAANGWSLETSTMYAPGEDSVAEDTAKTARKLPTVLYDHKQAPLSMAVPIADLSDDDLRSSLVYVYGPASEWMDIDGLIEQCRDPQNRESDIRRYWFNQPWTLEEKFTTPHEWDALADPSRDPADGDRVVLSLDGSYNNDCTAVSVVTVDKRPHVSVGGVWKRPLSANEDWKVDVLDVEETIRQLRTKYDVVELTADPARWNRSLQIMEDEGCLVTVFPQNASRMTPATSLFIDLIAAGPEKGMTQSGDLDLRTHVLNAVLQNDSRGKRLQKDHKKSANKIDLAVTTCMGLDRAMFYVREAEDYANVYFPDDERDATQVAAPEEIDGASSAALATVAIAPERFRILTQEETTVIRVPPRSR